MAGSWFRYKFEGFKGLSDKLSALTEPNFRRLALIQAGRKSMTPLLADLKAAAPLVKNPEKLPKGAKSGDLRDSIKIKVSAGKAKISQKTGKVTKASQKALKVSITIGNKDIDYAVVSEYGRAETPITKYHVFGRKTLGYNTVLPAIEARPWIRPTFDREKANVLERFATELGESINKQAKKQAAIKTKRDKI